MSGDAEDNLKTSRRSLRAVFAAEIAGFGDVMAVDETGAIGARNDMREILDQQLRAYEGWPFRMPGDGVFALFESAVNAVRCALETQYQLGLRAGGFKGLRLRVGIHLGDVLFEKDLPYGEALTIASRLEELADPGGILISAAVMDAVASRISATFEERGVPRLKNIQRRIVTFAVTPPPARTPADETRTGMSVLDRTTQLDSETLRQIRDQQFVEQKTERAPLHANGAAVLDRRPAAQPEPAKGSAAAVKPRPAPAPAAAPPPDDMGKPARPEPPAPMPQADARPDSPEEAARYRPSEECVESLIAAVAVHLGPFAKVLVNRMLKNASSAEHLVSLLEEQIQGKEERELFHIRALHICMTFADRQSEGA